MTDARELSLVFFEVVVTTAGQRTALQSTKAAFCSVETLAGLGWQEPGTVKGINSVLYNLTKVRGA